jgi:predicted ATPase/serine phosphatase RsbU (regulator of sigma subunit)
LIHKDINPSNLVWNPKTNQLKIIDFSISTRLSRETPTLKNPEGLEGTLPYVSPEQTGRMNRALDYRTDFYSLGVSFYEMLTGRLPFSSADSLELVHCHIAKIPTPVREIKPNVPLVVCDIVRKLMAKNADDRYQSALGLKADLEKCLASVKNIESLDFELGQTDFSGRFQIPQKLYGRDQEIKILLQAFERVANPPLSVEGEAEAEMPGGAQLMLVAGYSGVGKSALVHEVHKPMTEKRGYFASGKFDQYQRNVPYSALTQAFNEFCRYLLTESAFQLNQWREKILAAVGNNGQVLIEIISALKLIIGPQPPIPQVGPTEAQNRFLWVFQNFVKAISQKQHPLVMFIDDWQWADSASLSLLKVLLTDPDIQYFLIIGAYRDNEVDASHPFRMTLEELQKQQAVINTLTLDNLSFSDVNALIAEALQCDSPSAQPLTALVYEKTLGNAFFTTAFLKALYEEALLVFDFNALNWQWDLEKIRAKQMTNNVVDLMVAGIRKFLPQTQQVLKLAACIGNQFDLQTLAVIHKHTAKATLEALWQAVVEGLIIPFDENYKNYKLVGAVDEDSYSSSTTKSQFKFQHDRIQQAAYALVPDSDKPALHLEIGRLLLANTRFEELEKAGSGGLEEQIFEIVNQLNGGHALMTEEAEKVSLVGLNLQAGKKAKAGTAYQPALNYLALGIQLLGESAWDKHYAIAFELHKNQGECEFLLGHFDNSDQLLAIALEKAHSKFDKAEIYVIKIAQLAGQGKYHESVAAAIEALNMFGMNVPTLNQTEAQAKATAAEMVLYQENMKNRQIEDLYHLPLMQDEAMKVCSQIIAIAFDSLVIGVPDLLAFYATKIVNMSIQYGLSAFTPAGYSFFTIILSGGFKDYTSAYQFAALALQLNREKLINYSVKTKIYNVYGFFKPLREHINASTEGFRETYRLALEGGDFAYAGYAIHEIVRYVSPLSIEEGLKATEETIAYCQKANNVPILFIGQMYESFLKNLQGDSLSQTCFDYNQFTEEAFLKTFEKPAPVICALYKRYKLQSLSIFENYEQALPLVHERATWIAAFGGVDLSLRSDYFLYAGITVAALYPKASDEQKLAYMEILEECIAENQLLSDQCKINFYAPYLILEAEKARLENRPMAAMHFYDKAILSARQHEYLCNEAVASELAAKFWLALQKEDFANFYIKTAHAAYGLWGATAKVSDLETKYQNVRLKAAAAAIYPTDTITPREGTTTFPSLNALDFTSLLKASQAIAGEIELGALLIQLMKIIIENAGAREGFLILEKNGQWVIEAEGAIDKEEVTVLQSIPVNPPPSPDTPPTLLNREVVSSVEKGRQAWNLVPSSFINYVARTQESLILYDATEEKTGRDSYFIENQVKSALCVPLLNQGKLIGILYLENNLIEGAFTPDRLEVLNVLSSQAAISLENALLYRTLEQKVEERTAQLAEANIEISALNEQLKSENLRMSAELDVSRQLQQMLLPKEEELQIEGLDIAGFMEPADEVGGDYYDVLSRQGRVLMGIGDVTGHGLESGALAIMVQTAVRTLLANNETDPVKFLQALNEAIYENVQRMESDKNMTIALLDYQPGSSSVSQTQASVSPPLQNGAGGILGLSGQHEEMIVVRNGNVELIDTMDLGFPIGLVDEIEVNQAKVPLNPGNVVVLYTDGITEAENMEKEEYGQERLCEVVKLNWQQSAEEICQAVIDDVRQFIGQQKILDDITLLVLKQK